MFPRSVVTFLGKVARRLCPVSLGGKLTHISDFNTQSEEKSTAMYEFCASINHRLVQSGMLNHEIIHTWKDNERVHYSTEMLPLALTLPECNKCTIDR